MNSGEYKIPIVWNSIRVMSIDVIHELVDNVKTRYSCVRSQC